MQCLIITAYHNFEQLERNLTVWSRYFNCYVHIDKKADIATDENIKKLNQIENVYAESKYKINWGSYLHLMAILDLIRVAQKNEDNKYYHIISGDDYPLKKPEEFYSFFDNNDKCYMECTDITNIPAMKLRYEIFHFMHLVNRKGKNKPLIFIDKVVRKIQTVLKVKRHRSFQYKGLVWGSFSRKAVDYVINRFDNSNDVKFLKYCEIPEEFLFQNYLMDSDFKQNVDFNNLRYSNWDEYPYTGPRVLKMEDYETVKNFDAFFARKIVIGTELYSRLEHDFCQ